MGLADVVDEFDEDMRVYIDRQEDTQSRTKDFIVYIQDHDPEPTVSWAFVTCPRAEVHHRQRHAQRRGRPGARNGWDC